jgi:hypothetical protein
MIWFNVRRADLDIRAYSVHFSFEKKAFGVTGIPCKKDVPSRFSSEPVLVLSE